MILVEQKRNSLYISRYKFFQPMKNEFHKSQVEVKRGKTQRPKTINYYEKVGSNITYIYLHIVILG